jgi:hypothetical protein
MLMRWLYFGVSRAVLQGVLQVGRTTPIGPDQQHQLSRSIVSCGGLFIFWLARAAERRQRLGVVPAIEQEVLEQYKAEDRVNGYLVVYLARVLDAAYGHCI